jgi:hypothetical protein
MLPLTFIILAFYLGQIFCERAQYLTGLFIFLVISLLGVVVSCYLEAVVRQLLKECASKTVAAYPHLFRSRKPRAATASHTS